MPDSTGNEMEERIKILKENGFRLYEDDKQKTFIRDKLRFSYASIKHLTNSSFKTIIETMEALKND